MTALWPGATIGVLGGGQLARMLALEARSMGYRVVVLDPDANGSAAQVADDCVVGALDDLDAAQELARRCDVVTLDTEHVPHTLLQRLEAITRVRPSANVLRIVQDRLEQRMFLTRERAQQVPYAAVSSLEELRAAVDMVQLPAVLKTRRSGYDGKGQTRIDRLDQLEEAWNAIGQAPAVLESFVRFDKEISVLLARDPAGNITLYPIAENDHRQHILWITRAPARVSAQVATAAAQLAERIAAALDHVGMLGVELFVLHDGSLLVNELAPRTHNSGHYTFGACATSQFQQHVRAICGLPLGDPSLLRPAVMLNLLGDLWEQGAPAWSAVLASPNAYLHLYGKGRASPGRKMGHVLILDDDVERAYRQVVSIDAELKRRAQTSA